jgi:glucose/mannose transport system substrate-binding protein
LKGSLPVRPTSTPASWTCARRRAWRSCATEAPGRRAEVYLTPDQNGALQDVLTAYWNTSMPVEKAQKSIASALRY